MDRVRAVVGELGARRHLLEEHAPRTVHFVVSLAMRLQQAELVVEVPIPQSITSSMVVETDLPADLLGPRFADSDSDRFQDSDLQIINLQVGQPVHALT